jgi:hypothetical protein
MLYFSLKIIAMCLDDRVQVESNSRDFVDFAIKQIKKPGLYVSIESNDKGITRAIIRGKVRELIDNKAFMKVIHYYTIEYMFYSYDNDVYDYNFDIKEGDIAAKKEMDDLKKDINNINKIIGNKK